MLNLQSPYELEIVAFTHRQEIMFMNFAWTCLTKKMRHSKTIATTFIQNCLFLSLSLPLLSLCPQLKNRLTQVSGTKTSWPSSHTKRGREWKKKKSQKKSVTLTYVCSRSAFCPHFSPSILVCCSAEKRDRNKCGSSSHGATPHKTMHNFFYFYF